MQYKNDDEKHKRVTYSLDPDTIYVIDRIARDMNITRSSVIERMVTLTQVIAKDICSEPLPDESVSFEERDPLECDREYFANHNLGEYVRYDFDNAFGAALLSFYDESTVNG